MDTQDIVDILELDLLDTAVTQDIVATAGILDIVELLETKDHKEIRGYLGNLAKWDIVDIQAILGSVGIVVCPATLTR